MAGVFQILRIITLVSVSWALDNGDVRLVDGPSSNKGRVEVYYDGQWGTICDDSWHRQDGDTICKQLGYEYADYVYFRAYYGQGTGPIWIDQIHCNPGSASILDCRHLGWNMSDCSHKEDAAVDCKRIVAPKPRDLPVRLSCPLLKTCGSCNTCAAKVFPDPDDCSPQEAVEGIVEVLYDDKWHPVSKDGWDLNSANVVCGELGYPLAMGIPTLDELWCEWNGIDSGCFGSGFGIEFDQDECELNADFRGRMKTSWIRELECTGMENKLNDCYLKEWGPTTSSVMNVATVRCGYASHPECNINNTNIEMYRTRGAPVSWKGRIEVRVNGEWGTISHHRWGIEDASIVCRAMGYGSAERTLHSGFFGRGIGKVHFSHLNCDSSEKLLSECKSYLARPWQSHDTDAGMLCRVPKREDACNEPKVSKIAPQRDDIGFLYTNFVEMHGSEGWGLMCSGSMTMEVASVVCRESMEMFPFRIRAATHHNPNKTKYICSLACKGDERSLHNCPGYCLSVKDCRDKVAVVDCSAAIPDLVPQLSTFWSSIRFAYVATLPMYYLTCASEENCLSSSAKGKGPNSIRQLLRFSSNTMNYGTAPFQPTLNRADWIWHTCHNHYHSFEEFIHYDLIDPKTGMKAAEGHKASFCLEDSQCEARHYPRFRCGTGTQGISVNCGDVYGSHLDCQWIDITDVPSGRYILRQSVNPTRLALESDYENNIVECTIDITLYGYYGTIQGVKDSCRLSDH